MTDISVDWTSPAIGERIKKRHRADLWLKGGGMAALGFALLMLFILVSSLVSTGADAFRQTHVTLDFEVTEARVAADDIFKGNFRAIVNDAIEARFPEVTSRAEKRLLTNIPSNGAQTALRDAVIADPSLIGRTVTLTVPVSDQIGRAHV